MSLVEDLNYKAHCCELYRICFRNILNPFLTPSGNTTRSFVGHSKDVLSVAFSADNRQIVSGSRDRTVKLWNTLGVCKYTIQVNVKLCSAVSNPTIIEIISAIVDKVIFNF